MSEQLTHMSEQLTQAARSPLLQLRPQSVVSAVALPCNVSPTTVFAGCTWTAH